MVLHREGFKLLSAPIGSVTRMLSCVLCLVRVHACFACFSNVVPKVQGEACESNRDIGQVLLYPLRPPFGPHYSTGSADQIKHQYMPRTYCNVSGGGCGTSCCLVDVGVPSSARS